MLTYEYQIVKPHHIKSALQKKSKTEVHGVLMMYEEIFIITLKLFWLLLFVCCKNEKHNIY